MCVCVCAGAGGKLPTSKTWKTQLTAIENERELPSPKTGRIHEWTTNTPKIQLGQSTVSVKGNGKKRTYTVPLAVDYPYGEDGYKDVRFTLKASKNQITDLKVTGDTSKAARTLSFAITTSEKETKYTIEVTIKSASTGLTSTQTQYINYKRQTGIGKGGTEDIITDEVVGARAMKRLHVHVVPSLAKQPIDVRTCALNIMVQYGMVSNQITECGFRWVATNFVFPERDVLFL